MKNIILILLIIYTTPIADRGLSVEVENGEYKVVRNDFKRSYLADDSHCLNKEKGYWWTNYVRHAPSVEMVCVKSKKRVLPSNSEFPND